MANRWESSTINYSDDEIRIGHFTNHYIGKYYKDAGRSLAVGLNLYNFFVHNLHKPDEFLAKAITYDNKRIFTETNIKDIKHKINSQSDSPYFKKIRLLRHNGGGGTPLPGPEQTDKSRNGFWDKIIRKMTFPITSRIPEDGWVYYIFWWIHILYHMEQMDIYGPFISQFLDTVTLSLPIMADLTQEVAQKLIGLAPIPYASIIGEGLGYFISLMFIGTAVLLNNSRRHFGAAFKTALDAIPIVGETVSGAAINFETGADRFAGYKKKLQGSIGKISPTAGNIIYSYVPDTDIHTEALPPIDVGKIGEDIQDYAEKKTGLDKVTESVDKIASANIGSVSIGQVATIPGLKNMSVTKKGGHFRNVSRKKRV